MKYYREVFGLKVNPKGLPTIHCICDCIFAISYEQTMASSLFRCPNCNELWHFEYIKTKHKYVLIRTKSNAQIWRYK